MPPLPPVPGVIRIALKGTVGPFNWVNVLHFTWSGTPPTSTVLGTLGSDVGAAWLADMSPMQDSDTALVLTTLTDLTSDTAAQAEVATPAVGSRTGDFLPASACYLVDYPVTVRYRGGHPRTYLSVGVFSDLADSAHWSTDMRDAVTSAWENFLGAIGGFSDSGFTVGNPVAVSYVNRVINPVPPYRRTTPLVLPLDGITFPLQLANQRRRIGRK